MNPKPPQLRTQIKTHKPGNPIRPVVNFRSAPAYKISKKIGRILKDKLKLQNKYTIANSIDLVNTIKNYRMENKEIFLSLDIKNLYNNIPIQETIQIIDNTLRQKNENSLVIEQLTEITRLILQQNYFMFNNEIYVQNEGVAMGSPLSGIISEIFLQNLEDKVIETIIKKHNIKLYRRYVDDIILICEENRVNDIVHDFNNLHNKLNFTYEKEETQTLNYLDICLRRRNNKIEFSIYRKNTFTDTVIHKNSNHPYKQKIAAFNNMIHRMLNIPMNKDNYNKELNTIFQIATNNGYKKEEILTILKKQKTRRANMQRNTTKLTPITQKKNRKFTTFTYTNKQVHKITKHFMKETNIAFRTHNTIKNKLYNATANKTDTFSDNGVYKLTCTDCSKVYVGQTGRQFRQRYKEHSADYKHERRKSAFAKHLLDEKHKHMPIEQTLEVLYKEKKGNKLNTLEALEIYKHKNNIINEESINHNPLFELILNTPTEHK